MLPIHCPYCKNSLHFDGNRSYVCENNHNFDLAKQGYLNLLPVNKKKSKSPGDDNMMVTARRNFLESGYYNPLMSKIKEVIETKLSFDAPQVSILDSGCGEGYYSEHALNQINGLEASIVGTDISKHAVRQAAGKYKNNFYFVSSIYDLPIKENSIDIILSVFSPNDPKEFNRVLKDKGYLIVVSPGKNHMKQLAELIYDSFRPHEFNIPEKMGGSFESICTERKTFDIRIEDSSMLMNLLKMTPYFWNTSEEAQEKIMNCSSIAITCDFQITLFKLA